MSNINNNHIIKYVESNYSKEDIQLFHRVVEAQKRMISNEKDETKKIVKMLALSYVSLVLAEELDDAAL